MPTFIFKCPKCKEKKELLVPADKKVECEKCHVEMVKVPSTFGFTIK